MPLFAQSSVGAGSLKNKGFGAGIISSVALAPCAAATLSAILRRRAMMSARAASLIIEATGWTPPTINRVLAGAMSRPLVFNLVVSNVPGPREALPLLGAPVDTMMFWVPQSGDVGLGVHGGVDAQAAAQRRAVGAEVA